ncbi:hypothetical protein HYPSUDRAFT_997864 [Hypholoma sublateritium FD-334 SS-4]|uniref:Uncharacterized protein n=1 Tax=Hypholoma sublateritium (strain FD-334 SS-4) TaxID=945553 RepID=A0A0D2NFT9_HYPSF|nr:hypothetical protein HYPSUDRAFT_997864 [Hypholoma sublateritium FD-334 SS-4]
MEFFGQSVLWATMALINLAASIIIYQTTKLENTQKREFEYELSTQRLAKSAISLPRSFTHLSIFTGVLNIGSALIHFQRIYLLQIPQIPWQAIFSHATDASGNEQAMNLFDAELIVAANDWNSFFLCFVFLFAGLWNFATARQLRLRERWVKTVLLPAPAPRPNWFEVGVGEGKDVPGRVTGGK